MRNIINFILIFSYIFSYYILGPINVSFLILGGILFIIPFSHSRVVSLKYVSKQPYVLILLLFQIVILSFCLLYSVIFHETYDLSYLKVMFGQLIHFFTGCILISFLRVNGIDRLEEIEKYIVYSFVAQSVIQLLVTSNLKLRSIIVYFNHANDILEGYNGVRGVALATGVGWNLALAYGLVFIVYVKRFLLEKVTSQYLLMGILLFVGIFFAGRTGFVGVLIGMLLFLFSTRYTFMQKFKLFLIVIVFIAIFCLVFMFLFPGTTEWLVEKVFPFAFEFLYKYADNGEFETQSTNVLMRMWDTPIQLSEIFFGTGHFTNEIDGSYYKRVDVGILRNLFYWGVLGYILMIVYQIYQIVKLWHKPFQYQTRRDILLYLFFIFLFLSAMEFKAMTIGFNKMIFSIMFLLGFYTIENNKNNK